MPILLIILALIILGIIAEHWDIIVGCLGLILVGGLLIFFVSVTSGLGLIPIALLIVYAYFKKKEKQKKQEEEELRRQKERQERELQRQQEIQERKRKQRTENQAWLVEAKCYTDEEIWQMVEPLIRKLNWECVPELDQEEYDLQLRRVHNYLPKTMPWGRINAFINQFKGDITKENPWFFYARRSKKMEELCEYGVAITDKAIYFATQDEKYIKDEFVGTDDYRYRIPFAGLKSVGEVLDHGRYVTARFVNVLDDGTERITEVKVILFWMEALQLIVDICNLMINKGITRYYLMVDGGVTDSFINESFHNNQNNIPEDSCLIKLGLWNSASDIKDALHENKNLMNGRQGGGYAAEYGNNAFDRIQGINAENTAQDLDANGRQVKFGADRTVDGIEIQTKYYKTPGESISAVFENGSAKYMRSDGSGKMMVIEVPRDQYYEALELMQKRIDSGQVPGVEPGESATNYVRRGYFSYQQAWNIAKAGTIEGLVVDTVTGAISTSATCGISVILKFAHGIWDGKNVADAVKDSLIVGMNVMGRGIFVYTLTSQLTRSQIAIPFVKNYLSNGQIQGLASVSNPIYTLSSSIVDNVTNSAIAKSGLGKTLHLDSLTEKALISNALFAVITFGPDVLDYLSGEIDGQDFAIKASLTATQMTGFAVGNAIIPGLGGILLGAAAGGLGKMFIEAGNFDYYIPEMYGVMKQEFIEASIVNGLSREEIQKFAKKTIQDSGLKTHLKAMNKYQVRDTLWEEGLPDEYCQRNQARVYCYENYIKPAIDEIISNREHVTMNSFYKGLEAISEQTTTEMA